MDNITGKGGCNYLDLTGLMIDLTGTATLDEASETTFDGLRARLVEYSQNGKITILNNVTTHKLYDNGDEIIHTYATNGFSIWVMVDPENADMRIYGFPDGLVLSVGFDDTVSVVE